MSGGELVVNDNKNIVDNNNTKKTIELTSISQVSGKYINPHLNGSDVLQ